MLFLAKNLPGARIDLHSKRGVLFKGPMGPSER
jgi:hypothetical protein